MLAVSVVVVFLGLLAVLVWLAMKAEAPDHPAQSELIGDEHAVGHVHGIGVDPADGSLYLASHLGVFRIADDGQPQRVADRWQDTMGFTVVGPGHFLASGHPDLTEDLPIQLGLIESRDAALTWQPLSLSGEADFHSLEAVEGRTWGFDSQTGRLLTSMDNRSWQTVADDALIDLAIDPSDPTRVLATTPQAGIRAYDEAGQAVPIKGPDLLLLDWPAQDLLVGTSVGGRVYVSADGGQTWRPTQGVVPGEVEALEVQQGEWYVATTAGVFSSNDDGRSWHLLVAHAE